MHTLKEPDTFPGSFFRVLMGWLCKDGLCRKKERTRYLYAFDFDHTIVNENSDSAITEIITQPIPDSLRNFYDGTNWTEFMDYIFRFVASEGGTVEALKGRIERLELTPGMNDLLEKISGHNKKHKPQSHLIIISDANDFFIGTRLLAMHPPVIPNSILSNHATYSPDKSYLKIYPYEDQTSCDICPRNMCKGNALSKYIFEHGPFTQVYYCGDGANDLCPGMRLTENDILFVRHGFTLQRILTRGSFRGRGNGSLDEKYLYVFDFDHTIVDKNSDTAILDLIPNRLPQEIKSVYDGSNWTEYMNHVFRYLSSQEITVQDLKSRISKLEPVSGMEDLLYKISKRCGTNGFQRRDHLVVMSDANNLFIEEFLATRKNPVRPTQIISNPSTVLEDGSLLQIQPYHTQTECTLCPKNLCKGRALASYLETHGPFSKIYYAGDGQNDYCPGLKLGENDVLFAREGYRLAKLLNKHVTQESAEGSVIDQVLDDSRKVIAQVVFFEHAQVLDKVMQL